MWIWGQSFHICLRNGFLRFIVIKFKTNPHNIDKMLIFWNFQVRGPYISKINMSKITWEPWKLKFLPDPALALLKTYKSIFLFSGLPKFVRQGCHISVGYKDRISKIIPDIGQKVNLKCPVTGISVAFSLSFLLPKIEVCVLLAPQRYYRIIS